MTNAQRLTVFIALALIAFAAGTATATQGVSPGALDRVAVIESRCPTFSWGEDDNAAAYELVAYRLPESEKEAVEFSSENEVLFASVAGAATSWTPSADQCFAGGGRYVWFVRSVTELIDDQVIEAGEWSAGRYFQVPTGPSADELARALEVLKRWEAANGGGAVMLSSATATATATATGTAPGSGSGTGTGTGSSHLKSAQTASVAIRGDNPETESEAYGVVGTTASVWGAGVAAVNTEGGADLVLDGSIDGTPDTRVSEWGIDRSDPTDQVFAVANNGGGAITFDVYGTLRGTDLECPGCVSPSDLANESVTSSAIEDGGIGETDIGIGVVNTTHIFDGAIQAQDLAVDAIGGGAIVDGSITSDDLADGAVRRTKVATSAIGTLQIDDEAVTAEKISVGAVGASQIAFESIGESLLADEAVTQPKIAPGAVDASVLADAAVTGAKLADGAVDAGSLRNNAVTAAKIADDAVTTAKILNGSVTMNDLAEDSVGSDQIELGGVKSGDIDAGAVDTGHLADGAVTAAKLATGAITGAAIEDGTIVEADLAPASVGSSEIIDGSVTSDDLSIGVIGAGQIASDSIGSAEIIDGSITSADIGDSEVSSSHILNWSIDTAELSPNAVTSTKIEDGTIASEDIGIGAVTMTRILDQAVTSSKIAPNAVTGTKIAPGAVTAEKVSVTQIQLRVDSACAEGSSIRSIDYSGNVVCEPDDGGDLTPPIQVNGNEDTLPVFKATNWGTDAAVVGESGGEGGIGVEGAASSINGIALYGEATGESSTGVKGLGYSRGGYFESSGLSTGIGIVAKGGTNGHAAVFMGNVSIKDRITSDLVIELGKGLDYAEGFDVSDTEVLEPGTVLIIDPENPGELRRSTSAYDTRVAGIIAGANGLGSGVRLGAEGFDHDVALAGRVYCKVDAMEIGIRPGDLLTTSSISGHAMKAADPGRASGAILGKAMEPLDAGTTGQVLVLVGLQ